MAGPSLTIKFRGVEIPMAREIHSAYLSDALCPVKRATIIKNAIRLLTPHLAEFDAIAFRGVSGALIAPIIAHLLDKSVIVVRKPRMITGPDGRPLPAEGRHSHHDVEGMEVERYLIMDDFISGGGTFKAIKKAISDSENFSAAKPVAVYCYSMHYSSVSEGRKAMIAPLPFWSEF